MVSSETAYLIKNEEFRYIIKKVRRRIQYAISKGAGMLIKSIVVGPLQAS